MPRRSFGAWTSSYSGDRKTGISIQKTSERRESVRAVSFLGPEKPLGLKTGTLGVHWPRFPLLAPKSGTFGLRWRGMERRVLCMPRGPSAGITTIRYTELEVPRETISVSRRAESVRVEAESK